MEAEIGVFGGSGFYSFLEDVEEVEIDTPWPWKPSAPFTTGEVGGKRVAFLPRHGRNHELPPHAIPYRANVWAMRELGVRRIIGPNASGALKAELSLGEPGRLRPVRRSHERPQGHVLRRPETTHVSAADPYCSTRAACSSTRPRVISRSATAGRSSSSRARASPPAPSRSGSRPPASTRST